MPQTGDAFCRRMPTTQAGVAEVVKAEQEYEISLTAPTKTVEKKIELF